MSNFSCQEFCNEFNVWIGFDQSGYGQVFGKKPTFIERDSFFLSADDAKLLPCLVNDYYNWSKKRRVILFSPGEQSPEINEEIGGIIECNAYKKGDAINSNVIIKNVIPSDTKTTIICSNGDYDFIWNTKSKTLPNINDRKFLRAKIVENCASVDMDIPAFEVTSCTLLREKK